jgi:hypothetical protein
MRLRVSTAVVAVMPLVFHGRGLQIWRRVEARAPRSAVHSGLPLPLLRLKTVLSVVKSQHKGWVTGEALQGKWERA